MSTRCQIMFHWGVDDDRPQCLIYRHSDGYPEGVLPDLDEFFDDLEKNVPDNRFNDPCYLSAKLLVWLTQQYNVRSLDMYKKMVADAKDGDDYWQKKLDTLGHPCDFLGHGIDLCLHGDIEYLYHIHCHEGYGAGRPLVTWERVTDEVYDRYKHLLKAADKKIKVPPGVMNKGIPAEVQ